MRIYSQCLKSIKVVFNDETESGIMEKLPHAKGVETVLVVDDEDSIWDFEIEALQNLGYSVILAENGVDAVEIYENNISQIDLVLLDMIMPKLGGHGTFSQIKSMDPDASILLSSGFVSEEEVNDLLIHGADGFMQKPHRVADLAKEIRRILDGKKSAK